MFCGSCGAPSQPGQRFCGTCGAALGGALPLPTPATTTLQVVEQTPPPPPDAWGATPPAGIPQVDTAPVPVVGATTDPRTTPLVVVAASCAVTGIVAAFTRLFTIESDGIIVQTSMTKDLFENTTVAMIVAAVVLVGGALLGSTGRRIGSGLAGGAGLATLGISAMHVGLVLNLFDTAEQDAIDEGRAVTLRFVHELGFWAFAAAGVAGLVVFAMALRDNLPDGHAPLSGGVAALGALATVAVVVGPLIPRQNGSFGDNFETDPSPWVTIARLLSLLLIGLAGWIGFLSARRWGVGMALGGISVGLWQWFTTLTQDDTVNLGIAFTNPGSFELSPHPVTTVGVLGMLAAAVLMLVLGAQRPAAPAAPS
jgi:hypothetical protein